MAKCPKCGGRLEAISRGGRLRCVKCGEEYSGTGVGKPIKSVSDPNTDFY